MFIKLAATCYNVVDRLQLSVYACMHPGPSGWEQQLREAIVNVDQQGEGRLSLPQFETLLTGLGVELTRHQIISMHRRLAGDGAHYIHVDTLLQALLA
jgi:hypothetical protein